MLRANSSGLLLGLGRRLFSSAGRFDLTVIGGGPGGYVAAIKAAQLGMKVACVEKRGSLGGTCLNVGCIPSKALLHASHLYETAHKKFGRLGLVAKDVGVNVKKLQANKERTVKGLCKGIEVLFKQNGVEYVKGYGTLTSPNEINVALTEGGESLIETDKILLATGSDVSTIPGVEIDEKRIISSTGALSLKEVPKHLIVIGAGVIGLEMGSVWARFGAKVTAVEYMPTCVPGLDLEISDMFQKILQRQKFKFHMSTQVMGATPSEDGVAVTVKPREGGEEKTLEADYVLVATGRRPYTDGLGLENVGIELSERGFIPVDDEWRTSQENIFAIGDATGGPMLAHKAEEEGVAAVEIMSGLSGHVNYNAIPGVIYTSPEVASVGRTEEELVEAGVPHKIGRFPMQANSRARAIGESDGMVKVLSHAESDELLGMHIIGANAGELIHEGVLGIEYGATATDIARACHAHPTLAEAVKEGCMAASGKAIHA